MAEEAFVQRIPYITDTAEEPDDFLLPIGGYEKMPLVRLEVAVEKLVDLLPAIKCYTYVAKQRCQQPADGLTQDESAAIMLYSMGWKPHDQCLYFVLNATLRSSDRCKLKPWFLYLRLLLNGLFRLPKMCGTVYRCAKLDLSNKYIIGKTVVWWAFSLCTCLLNTLQSEQYLGKTGSRTLFIIEFDSGRDIRRHSFFSSVDELLLMAATQFQVIDYLDQGDLHIFRLKEIQPIYPLLQPVPLPLMPIHRLSNPFLSIPNFTGLRPMLSASGIVLRPTLPVPNLTSSIVQPTALVLQSIAPKSSSLYYRNSRLKRILHGKQSKSQLSFSSMQLTDQDMEILGSYLLRKDTKLTSLNLGKNQIGVQGVQHLSNALQQNSTLTTLNLEHNEIGNAGIQYLSEALQNNTALTSLYLDFNEIKNEGIKYLSNALQRNTTLTTLSLSYNKIGERGAQYLSDALRNNITLTTLSLSANEIGENGAKHLSDALRHNSTLITLNLESNQIGSGEIQYFKDTSRQNNTAPRFNSIKIQDEGIKHLSDALRENTALTTLRLSSNTIGDFGIQYLSDALRQNSTLTTLVLSFNRIQYLGAQYLRDALLENKTLTILDLGYNNLNEEGIQNLTSALQQNTTITILSLCSNDIKDKGTRYLCDALLNNTTLTTLNLANNNIGDRGAQYLHDALQSNTTLTTLNFENNRITDRGQQYLIELTKINKNLNILVL